MGLDEVVLDKVHSFPEPTRYPVTVFFAGLTFLLILAGHYFGNVFPPGLSLALPLLLLVFYLSTHRVVSKKEVFLVFSLISFCVILFASVLAGNYNEYGAYKISALSFSFFVPVLLFLISANRILFARLFLYVSLFFLVSYGVFVLGFKLLQGGVFERTLMGVNGPIVFARLMIFGLITALFLLKGWWRSFLICFFLFMALISYSKGPLLGVFVVFILFVRMKYSIVALVFFLLGVVVFSEVFQRYINFFLDLFYAVYNGDLGLISSGGNEGSVGERLESFYKFINIDFDYFLGSGIGMWSVVFDSNHIYPHNLIIEMVAEFGVLFFFVFAVSLSFGLAGIFKGKWRDNLFFALSVFFLISSMFSGSVVDARYFFFFFVVAVVLSNDSGAILNKGLAE
jgi:hypothetical protein